MGQVPAPSLDIQGCHWSPVLTSPVVAMLHSLTLSRSATQHYVCPRSPGVTLRPLQAPGPPGRAHTSSQVRPQPRNHLLWEALLALCTLQFLVQRSPVPLKSSTVNVHRRAVVASCPCLYHQSLAEHQQGTKAS